MKFVSGAYLSAFILILTAVPTQAAITAAGGTDTFSGITVADETLLVIPTDLTGWSEDRGTALGATQGAYSDNNNTGTCDGTAFTAGGVKPPENANNLKLAKDGNANNAFYGLRSPTVTATVGGTTVWTFYFAQNGAAPAGTTNQVGRYPWVGVNFTGATNPQNIIAFAWVPASTVGTGGDLRVFHGNYATGQGSYQIDATANLRNNVGAGDADGNDYLFGQWNRIDIAITLTDAGTGTAVLQYNGATIETVTLTGGGDLTAQRLVAGFGPFVQGNAATRRLYLDDVSARLVPAAQQTTVTDSFTVTGTPTFGARLLDGGAANNETPRRVSGVTYAWGARVNNNATVNDHQIYIGGAATQCVEIKGPSYQAGARIYTRFDSTTAGSGTPATFPAGAGANVPSVAVDGSQAGSRIQVQIRQQPVAEALALAVLIRDPTGWYQSSPLTVAGPVTSASPVTLEYDFHGGSAVTWTRVLLDAASVDMDEVDQSGEAALTYGTAGAGAPNLASIEGMGVIVPTSPTTALTNTQYVQVGEISLIGAAASLPNAAPTWLKFF